MKKNILIFIMLVIFTSLFSQTTKPDALALYREGKYAESIAICIQEIQVLHQTNHCQDRLFHPYQAKTVFYLSVYP